MHRDAIKPEGMFHSGFFLSMDRTAQPLAAIACEVSASQRKQFARLKRREHFVGRP
ncbi:hypothetical protein [Rhizobium leguminosarum]|uniref:hypothetical protein n=1 Tax=Rhizobium TaxID=379 RepID=UPI001C95C267|nr:hypothetical protein [Rhizobium leguminosarum]MBY5392884.1 hypothetical protein [Rhizobium leguminosarum]MBY5434448.1 hypothetical protein [Rhizobium leguminosarum]